MVDRRENALVRLNQAIAGVALPPLSGKAPKTIFICGTPRSGTTVLYQALSYVGDVGYISNLAARFYAQPRLGIDLAQALDLPKHFTGQSHFGQTTGLTEPHEFGRFWERTLGCGLQQPDDPRALPDDAVRVIEDLSRVFARPTLFKSFAYLWYIEALDQALNGACWVHITRDLAESAQSLQKLYMSRAGETGPPMWTSMVCSKTRQTMSQAPLPDRCLAQIKDVDAHIRSGLEAVAPARKISVPLDSYIENPTEVVHGILDHFNIARDPRVSGDIL